MFSQLPSSSNRFHFQKNVAFTAFGCCLWFKPWPVNLESRQRLDHCTTTMSPLHSIIQPYTKHFVAFIKRRFLSLPRRIVLTLLLNWMHCFHVFPNSLLIYKLYLLGAGVSIPFRLFKTHHVKTRLCSPIYRLDYSYYE